MSYCSYVKDLPPDNLHRHYHDHEYGFPLVNDNDLFGRLLLEINQAGLSWATILKKQKNFYSAYDRYDIKRIAGYKDPDRTRLLQDAGIIRNRLKIEAAIFNAGKILQIQNDYGSFREWLDQHHPRPRDSWTELFRKNFKFTGGEIVNEFLVSTGYLPGSHTEECPVFERWRESGPPCLR